MGCERAQVHLCSFRTAFRGSSFIYSLLDPLNCYILLFFFGHEVCGILVPRSGIEPGPSAVKAQSPNHWTAREFPKLQYS